MWFNTLILRLSSTRISCYNVCPYGEKNMFCHIFFRSNCWSFLSSKLFLSLCFVINDFILHSHRINISSLFDSNQAPKRRPAYIFSMLVYSPVIRFPPICSTIPNHFQTFSPSHLSTPLSHPLWASPSGFPFRPSWSVRTNSSSKLLMSDLVWFSHGPSFPN